MVTHEAQVRAGAATEDVTPGKAVVMSGYGAREGPSTGIHDPLSVTALVLADGAVTVAVISIDVLNVSREFTSEVESALMDEGIDLDCLLPVATHTHAGPYVPARALDVSPPLRTDHDVSETVARLQSKVVRAVETAYGRLEPATIRLGTAIEAEVPENRRAAGGVSGHVRMPSGETDPEVTVALVETDSGTETVVYNFACHPVCTTAEETLLSADWPGFARDRIRAERDAHVLFVNGAAGDINPHGSGDRRGDLGVYEYMERVGHRVGDAVCRAVADAESADRTVERAPLCIERADLALPVKSTPPAGLIRDRIAELETTHEDLDRAGEEAGYANVSADLQYARELLAIAEWDAHRLPARLTYVEIGDLGILGMPGEILVAHGLAFKREAEVGTLMPVGYAGGYVGYLPTLSDLERVGYEVRTMKVAPEAIVEFREAALGLVSGDSRGSERHVSR
ncbi:neutral/alkaline non-lysosomal ceramidase N-terminal domain-containing protein [Saliphagus sp. LR7]|uniref:neutral/alkaline non-lysosomal ceramidase N-terminal domain-containing protein n=1 Tax=Saliphagus sp. LR7 TaxID=2282654 RepID=UPI000DF75409|nr:neutral/alkaline non-lysosomal ceramidase N-terminal domain-containing protein [Saliphagus sp. LR7]